eukprot:2853902-Rhodomonas_salina.1
MNLFLPWVDAVGCLDDHLGFGVWAGLSHETETELRSVDVDDGSNVEEGCEAEGRGRQRSGLVWK